MNKINTATNDAPRIPTCNESNAVAAARRTGLAMYGTSPSVNAPYARMRYIAAGVGFASAHLPPRKYPNVR